MSNQETEPETETEWQFEEWEAGDAAPGGGGLLKQILDRMELLDKRVTVLSEEIVSVRAELTTTSTQVSETVAAHFDAETAKLQASLPTEQIKQLAKDLRELRRMLIGPT